MKVCTAGLQLSAVDAPQWVKVLRQAQRPSDRSLAAWSIGEIGPLAIRGSRQVVPALAWALKDDDAGVRHMAAAALAELGPAAKRAVRELAEALLDDDNEVRYHAARALQRIGPPAVQELPKLKEALGCSAGLTLCHQIRRAIGALKQYQQMKGRRSRGAETE